MVVMPMRYDDSLQAEVFPADEVFKRCKFTVVGEAGIQQHAGPTFVNKPAVFPEYGVAEEMFKLKHRKTNYELQK